MRLRAGIVHGFSGHAGGLSGGLLEAIWRPLLLLLLLRLLLLLPLLAGTTTRLTAGPPCCAGCA